MAPKKKKRDPDEIRCDQITAERFHAPQEDVFDFNWWEVFCFPYIICSRVWDCCVSLCSGTNQCLVYWMMIQWIVCKIQQITTPNPILFPYYFYMFCQVVLLTVFFVLLWVYMGKSVFIPFFKAFYIALAFGEDDLTHFNRSSKPVVTALRRYCFRKGEIFEASLESSAVSFNSQSAYRIGVALIEMYVHEVLFN